jgi:hypothetical protein
LHDNIDREVQLILDIIGLGVISGREGENVGVGDKGSDATTQERRNATINDDKASWEGDGRMFTGNTSFSFIHFLLTTSNR